MSCLRTCFDKDSKNYGYENCQTCKDNDSGIPNPDIKPDKQDKKCQLDKMDASTKAKAIMLAKHYFYEDLTINNGGGLCYLSKRGVEITPPYALFKNDITPSEVWDWIENILEDIL